MDSLPPALAPTRESLHRLAEHVVAPARHAVSGRIGLRPHPGGLRTPEFGDSATVVAVELDELVVRSAHGERRTRVTTLRGAGAFVGMVPGAPASVYSPATPCDLDAPLVLDRTAMRVLADWYLLGADVLRRWAVGVAADDPSEAQLWPEHLDLAMVAAGVNYGFSPGDEHVAEPYAYVGPHGGPPVQDEFWNASFGAVRRIGEVPSAAAVLDVFSTARERLTGARLREGISS
jgi:hypothetical protein